MRSDLFSILNQGSARASACEEVYRLRYHVSRQVSPPAGRDTCSYFFPDGKKVTSKHYEIPLPSFCVQIIYSSTMSGGEWCPAPPDQALPATTALHTHAAACYLLAVLAAQAFGYVWPLNKDMDIYTQELRSPAVSAVSYPNHRLLLSVPESSLGSLRITSDIRVGSDAFLRDAIGDSAHSRVYNLARRQPRGVHLRHGWRLGAIHNGFEHALS